MADWHPAWCEGHACRGSHHGAPTSMLTPYGELSVTPLYEHGKPMVEVDLLDGENVAASLTWPANEVGGFADFLSRFAPTYADPIADLFANAAVTARAAQPGARSA